MKKLKVSITGGSFINKGAEAMVLTVRDKLISSFPDIDIYMRVNSLYFKIAKKQGFIPINSDLPNNTYKKFVSKFDHLRQYMFFDAIIDVGGYQFGDPWGWQIAKKKSQTVKYCKMFNTKMILMPQAWGPFTQQEFSDYIPFILDNSSFFVRDKTSYSELENIFSMPAPADVLKPDIAWNFKVDGTDINKILTKYGIKKNIPTVCITPNLRVYERQKDNYLAFLLNVIEELLKKNFQIILMGHELRKDGDIDDRHLCKMLHDQKPSTIHIDEFLSANEVKSIIGLCDFVISSRFHALIAALSQRIPAVAIGWSHKYNELLSDVKLDGNILDISETALEIEKYFKNFIDGIERQKELLEQSVPELVRSSSQMLEEVVKIIKGDIR